MRSPASLITTSALAAALLGAALAPAAHATFPGERGRIAYETFSGVYSVRPDGTGTRRIAGSRAHDPEWSPDGRQILFQRNWRELWRARADGSRRRRILDSPAGKQVHDATWAPDGRRVAVELLHERRIPGADDGEVEAVHRIHTANVDGSGLRRLRAGMNPAWSPDGRLIAFVTERGVAVMRPDGGGFRLVHRVRGASSPDFAPDGRRLVYLEGAAPARIHTLDLATGRDRVLAPSRVGRPFDATWTPDGNRIAYLHQTVPASGPWPATRVYTIKPDGSAKRRLLTLPPDHHADELSWQPVR